MIPAHFLTVGVMNFGGRTPKDESLRIVRRAIDRGVTFFDTADAYGDGASEDLLGQGLRDAFATGTSREQVGVATKVGFKRRNGKPEGLRPEVVRTALEESLRRLGLEYVDVYYLHVPDHSTPIEETLDGVREVLASGKARAFGVSNYASWQIAEMLPLCAARGMPAPVMSQVLYNLLVRQLDLEYLAFARAHPALHSTVYNPLAGGLLARELKPGDAIPAGSRFDRNKLYRGRYWSEAMIEQAGRYAALAREAGLTPVQLAYAWISARRSAGVNSVLAGPGTVAHLDAAIDACELTLPPEVLVRIDQLHRAFTGTDVSYAR